jgi:dipicolinate synthase subunit B
MNSKNIYFVPMRQDDHINKPNSIVADFDYILDTVHQVLATKEQPQPMLL